MPLEDNVDSLANVLGDGNFGDLMEPLQLHVLFLGDVDRRRDLPTRHAPKHT